MFKLLGKLAKGFATVVGVSGAAASGGLMLVVDPSVNELLSQVLRLLTGLFTLLALFGIGRKAGATINE